MKHDYTQLDAALLADIKARGPLMSVRMGVGEAGYQVRMTLPYSTAEGLDWRAIDRRLQVLRKAGRIRYQRKPEGWVLAS